jgi:hypothetical protein
MIKLIYEFFSKNFLEKYFLFGKRWILLVPLLVVLTLFWFIQQFLGLPHLKTTITNPYFILPSLTIVAAGIAYYVWINNRPLPSDRFIVAVTKFQPVPESAMKEATILQHRVVQAFRDRMASHGIKGTAVALHETIDPSATDGHRQALILGRHYQAHLVIWGAVRLDEEYYFKPSITRLVTQPYRFFPNWSRDRWTNQPVIRIQGCETRWRYPDVHASRVRMSTPHRPDKNSRRKQDSGLMTTGLDLSTM